MPQNLTMSSDSLCIKAGHMCHRLILNCQNLYKSEKPYSYWGISVQLHN